MKSMQLTPSTLSIALEAIASAATEEACATALVLAAASVQGAVRGGQDPQSFLEALDSAPTNRATQLSAVLDRAVNFHVLEEGTLGFWLLPVTVSCTRALATDLSLETESLNLLKMAGCLQQQFGFSGSSADHRGWAYVLPTLLSAERLRDMDLSDLINLPWQARDVVRGTRDEVSCLSRTEPSAAHSMEGTSQFFLPVVVYHPAGTELALPPSSSKTMTRMAQWVDASLAPQLGADDTYAVQVAPQPHPFSVALDVGERQRLAVRFRAMLTKVCDQVKVHPNGMAALVAPYAVRQADGRLTLGVTLVSRMTQAVVATLGIPVTAEDALEEVALVTYILREAGMEHVQNQNYPIETTACQHCGNLQYAMPSGDSAFVGLATPAGHVH